MKILFCGSPKSAIPILEKIKDSKHELIGVVTQSAKPKGRDKKLTKTDIALYCIDNNIGFFETESIKKLFDEKLKSLDFDIAVVVAFGQIIPSELLAKPKYGWINLHYSLLPNLRGAAPVQWSILNNESETGITWFQIDKGLDTGPILLQKEIKLNNHTHDELIAELNNLATEKLDVFLDEIEDERIQKKDQTGEISYAPKLTDKDLKIDWNQNLDKIKSVIRTGNDHLSAWTQMNGEKIKILNCKNSDSEKLSPGHIQLSSKSVHVGTNSVSLVLDEVIPQGKKRMPALDWFNGIQSKENLKFE